MLKTFFSFKLNLSLKFYIFYNIYFSQRWRRRLNVTTSTKQLTDDDRMKWMNFFFHFQFSSPAFNVRNASGLLKENEMIPSWKFSMFHICFFNNKLAAHWAHFDILSLVALPSCFSFVFHFRVWRIWMNIHYQLFSLYLSWQRGFWLWSQNRLLYSIMKFSIICLISSLSLFLPSFASCLHIKHCVVPPNNKLFTQISICFVDKDLYLFQWRVKSLFFISLIGSI